MACGNEAQAPLTSPLLRWGSLALFGVLGSFLAFLAIMMTVI